MALLERPSTPGARRLTFVTVLAIAAAVLGSVAIALHRKSTPRPLLSAAGRPFTAEVINASGRTGMARLATKVLREKGVDVVYFGSDPNHQDSTVVIVRRGDSARGRDVAQLLGRARVTVARDTLRRLDVTVRLGRDYRLPAGRFPL